MRCVILFLLLVTLQAPHIAADRLLLEQARDKVAKENWKEAEEELRGLRQTHPEMSDATVLHALCLVRLHQPFDALLELEELLARLPDDVPALKIYATLVDTVLDEKARAEEILRKCTDIAPGDVEVWKALGSLYLAVNRLPQAIGAFETASQLAPNDPLVVAGLAYAHGQTGSNEKADELFAEAVERVRQDQRALPVVQVLYGDYQIRQGRPEKAVPALTSALEAAPDLGDALYFRALAFEKLGEPHRAEVDALSALAGNPNRKDALQLLIRIYGAQKKPEKVREYAQKLQNVVLEENRQLELGRELRESLNRAEPLLRSGRFQEAVSHYRRIVDLLPSFYEAYFALGICYFQMSQISEAENAFRRFLSYQPLSADGHAALGVLLVHCARMSDAQPVLERALQLDPGNTEARKALAQTFYWQGEFKRAIAQVEDVVRKEPEADADLYIMLARCWFAEKETEKAVAVCNQGIKVHGRSLPFLKSLGQLLLEEYPSSTETTRVVDYLARSFSTDPAMLLLKAKHCFLLGRLEECSEQARKVLALSSTDTPDKAEAFALLGTAEEKLGNLEVAEQSFRSSLEVNRRLSSAHLLAAVWYVRFLMRRGRDQEAEELLNEVGKSAPYSGLAILERAKLEARGKEREKAVESAKLALQYGGSDLALLRDAHAFLARTLFSLGRIEEAKLHQQWIAAHGESRGEANQ
jgi:tetratricopeptide (TPR) repeat protein